MAMKDLKDQKELLELLDNNDSTSISDLVELLNQIYSLVTGKADRLSLEKAKIENLVKDYSQQTVLPEVALAKFEKPEFIQATLNKVRKLEAISGVQQNSLVEYLLKL